MKSLPEYMHVMKTTPQNTVDKLKMDLLNPQWYEVKLLVKLNVSENYYKITISNFTI